MEKIAVLLIAVVFSSVLVLSQEESHDVSVINIEVPVRVFKAGNFVDNLSLDDFELYEDGVLQKIVAVYLIKKKSIKRTESIEREKPKQHAPKLSRNFVLVFEITDVLPKINKAIKRFFQDVLLPGDSLIIMTPEKVYEFKQKILETKSREEISSQLISILKKDVLTGNSEYKSTMRKLKRVVRAASLAFIPPGHNLRRIKDHLASTMTEDMSLDEILILYESLVETLENIRRIDQKQLLDFAEFLKSREGQKHVFLFYQREFLPQIDTKFLVQYMEMHQDTPEVQLTLSRLSEFFVRDISLDIEKVKQSYSDSSISIYFMYITNPAEKIPAMEMMERSEDVFNAFREMAVATGGTVESSASPEHLFRKAADASENYYLLYYRPGDYRADGRFRKIKVRVKGKDYRVVHRAGYFAN